MGKVIGFEIAVIIFGLNCSVLCPIEYLEPANSPVVPVKRSVSGAQNEENQNFMVPGQPSKIQIRSLTHWHGLPLLVGFASLSQDSQFWEQGPGWTGQLNQHSASHRETPA